MAFSGNSALLQGAGRGRLLELGHPPSEGRSTMVAAAFDAAGRRLTAGPGVDLVIGGTPAGRDPRSRLFLLGSGTLVFPAFELNRGPADKCAGGKRERLRGLPEVGDEPYHLRCPFADKRLALAVRVDGSGRVTQVGRYADKARVLRVLKVGDRVVAVTQNSVVLLDVDRLRRPGSAPTAWRAGRTLYY